MSEIALAASRKIKLRLLADNGNKNASKILDLQDNPGIFFTVVQIGLNAVAILGGIIGEGILNPYIINFLSNYQSISEKRVGTIASVFSFIFVILYKIVSLFGSKLNFLVNEFISIGFIS